MPRVAFYSDAAVIGGHERMLAKIANATAESGIAEAVVVHHHPEFPALLGESVRTVKTSVMTKTPFPGVRNLSIPEVMKTIKMFKELAPDLVLVGQGDVEHGIKGLMAARLLGLNVFSYVPYAYSFRQMGAPFGTVRDLFGAAFYQFPRGYVTISEYHKKVLQQKVHKPVFVIRNLWIAGSGTDGASSVDRKSADPTIIDIAVIGRIVFRHKNQDGLIDVAKECRRLGLRVRWHIVGKGPDENRFVDMVSVAGLDDAVVLHGWLGKREISELLRDEIDIVAIPSHFEGVPLVMLEAIEAGVPVLIRRFPWIDIYDLPESWLVDWGNPEMVTERIESRRWAVSPEQIATIQTHCAALHDPAAFRRDVVDTIERLLAESPYGGRRIWNRMQG